MGRYIIKKFLKQYLLFMAITVFFRILFLAYYYAKSAEAGFMEVISTFYYAFWLDNSSVNYLLIIPFFIYFFYSLFPVSVIETINKYYTYLFIILLTIIELGNIAIYNEWGQKINYKAVTYLGKLDEAVHSAQTWVMIIGAISIIILSFILIKLASKFIWQKPKTELKRSYKFSILWFLITPFVIFGSMRGSLEQIPISQSQSYHSKINFINQASVNTSWNLFHSILGNYEYMDKNPFTYFKIDEANSIVDKMYDFKKEKGKSILKTDRPNIVFIFLESWSADFIDELGGNLHITPNFSKMTQKGILFTEHYASGTLSHQGISATFSSFPSTPYTYIIELPAKYSNLSCFPKDLQDNGYHTSFLFGGQLNYGNIKAYIYYNKFNKITEGKDFPSDIPSGSLGHHDEFMLDKLLTDIDTYPSPFFAAAFTLSTHSPYDMPTTNFKKFDERYNQLLNSMYYADSCLNNFMTKAKTKAWYKNTLFVFVADHSHPSPFKHPYYSKEVRKIPLLFFGDVIKDEFMGKKVNTIMSQTDISATILAQLNMNYDKYHWSKNVFNPNVNEFAFFGFNNGYGFISPNGNYSFVRDYNGIRNYNFKTTKDSIETRKQGDAYVEVLFQEYLDY